MRSCTPVLWRARLALLIILPLAGTLLAQNAAVSLRTGDPTGWCPIVDSTGAPIDSGSFVGLYLVGDDGEVDPPSEEMETCGGPTDDDVRAVNNTIGNGMDHFVMGYQEPPIVPAGNLFTGNGAVMLPDTGFGTEPVINRGDRFYMRAFNSDSVQTATHYFNLFTVAGDTVDSYVHTGIGAAIVYVCFTDAIPLDCEGAPVEAEEPPNVITEYRLYQNYPNPFNPTTKIMYDVKNYGHVTLTIFNLLGQQVASVVDDVKDSGHYVAQFDGTRLATGIYFYEIQVNNFRDIKKMVLLR